MSVFLFLIFNLFSEAYGVSHNIDLSVNLTPAQCSEIQIDTSNMPKNNNQAGLEWCYSFSSADLLSFYEKKRLSSYDIAAQYHSSGSTKKMEEDDYFKKHKKYKSYSEFEHTSQSGNVSLALEALFKMDKGVCTEEDVSINGTEDWSMISNRIKYFAQTKNQCVDGKLGEKVLALGSNVKKILDKMSESNKLSSFFDLTCINRHLLKKKYKIYSEFIPINKKEDLLRSIDRVLESNMPTSIIYSSGLLIKGADYVGNPDHQSTVIGRRYNSKTNQCEYLIKNSWGNDCNSAQSIVCENGNYWVTRKSLMKNIAATEWIEEI